MLAMGPPHTRTTYRHGDLRNALIDAGVQLAQSGGPDAVVLREAARLTGVSPNAAYRHFATLEDLREAIADRARNQLADAMEAGLKRVPCSQDPSTAAVSRLRAVGGAYIHFAIEQPGLFRTALGYRPLSVISADRARPLQLLEHALDDLVDAGQISAANRPAALAVAWSAVHGLSTLLLGPLAELTTDAQNAAIELTMQTVLTGLCNASRPQAPSG
jgi:AcrR family transcriptional regulator